MISSNMLPLLLLLTFVLLMAWLCFALRGYKVPGIILGLILFITTALTSYRVIVVVQAVSNPVDKERLLLSNSMTRMEASLAKGDTETAFKAIRAFNQTLATRADESSFYEAVSALHSQLESTPPSTNTSPATKN